MRAQRLPPVALDAEDINMYSPLLRFLGAHAQTVARSARSVFLVPGHSTAASISSLVQFGNCCPEIRRAVLCERPSYSATLLMSPSAFANLESFSFKILPGGVQDRTPAILQVLAHMPGLRYLSLDFDFAELLATPPLIPQPLAELCLPKLHSLTLSGTFWDETGVRILRAARSSLKSLILWGVLFSGQRLASDSAIADALVDVAPNLVVFELHSSRPDGFYAPLERMFSALAHLETLELGIMGDSSMLPQQLLACAPPRLQLRRLYVVFNDKHSSFDFSRLLELPQLRKLRFLDILNSYGFPTGTLVSTANACHARRVVCFAGGVSLVS